MSELEEKDFQFSVKVTTLVYQVRLFNSEQCITAVLLPKGLCKTPPPPSPTMHSLR